MGLALKNYDIGGAALNAYKVVDDSFRAKEKLELERKAQNRADKESEENSQIRQLAIRKGLKQEADEAESAELATAIQTGDLSKLSPETAIRINKQIEATGITPDAVLPRLKSATIIKPMIDKLLEQSKSLPQQTASGQGLQQADTVHLSADPSFGTLKPHLKDLFFDKSRFNSKDGAPALHTYDIGGRQVMGVVDQSDPVADVIFHAPTAKVMVGLNVKAVKTDQEGKPLKDESGAYVTDETISIPNGIATKGRSNGVDDTVAALTLAELQQKTDELIKSGELVMGIRRRALETEFLRRSPVAREGLSKALAGRLENDQAWKSTGESQELKALYEDPVIGGALKNIETVTRAFGGSPKEALAKAHAVVDKAQTLTADKAEGQAFITTFSGILEAAGKNPGNPWSGITGFFRDNPTVIGKKGALDAVKEAQKVIASDMKTKQEAERDRQQWAKIELLANRSTTAAANTGSRTVNQEKRDVAVRLRDAQRNYSTAIKSGDPAVINEAIDLLEYTNDQAKEIGVPLVKVPARRETEEQTEVLRQQAIESLKAQRGTIGKFFNRSPNPKAVEAEMQRLRKTGAPANQTTAPHNQAVAPSKPSSAPPNTSTINMPPDRQPPQQTGKAFLSGNNVMVNGQSYPLNSDGTITIAGRKYRVQ